MKIYLPFVLTLNLLCFSHQTMEAYFFCDNYLKEIYSIDEDTQTQKLIANGWDGDWQDPYHFENLDAAPGEFIKFRCHNTDAVSYGAGCFLINNICRCYQFDNEITKFTDTAYLRTVTFKNNKKCSISIYHLGEISVGKDYYYTHYIPLDVNGITCKNNYVISVPNNVEVPLKLSDYIDANFDVKNLKINVIQSYDYFTLNNNKLTESIKFKIIEDVIFYSKYKTKINVKFKNYGVFLGGTKECDFNIRVCYDSCQDCYDLDSDDSNHQCKSCKDGYYFIENTNNCKTIEEMERTNYYLDENKKMFLKCYDGCLTCFGGGDINDMKCKSCANNKYLIEPGDCVEDITNYYYSEEDKIYKKCYHTCYSCNKGGDKNNNNCQKCNENYHFIYNEEGKCISSDEKPTNTYLDIETNTYKKCYERCSTCEKGGDNENNNCNECLKDENNSYIYHFIYNEEGKCINSDEKPSNTYLDNQSNTYKLCYEKCSSCDNGNNNNCNECLKDENNNYIYHFIYNEKGKCISSDEKPSNTYLDNQSNTYKLCYERCSTCDKGGDSSNNNCNECLKNEKNNYIYHFISNIKGKCINENEIKNGYYYLDEKDNTYKECPENTVKVENNECIKSKMKIYIIIIIIVSIIIILLILILVLRIIMRKRRNNNKIEIEEDQPILK